jgi:hypothetical protein
MGMRSEIAMKISPYPKVFLELKPTPMIPGEIGVFAVRRIFKGVVIVPATIFQMDVWMSWKQWAGLDPCTRRKLFEYCPGENEGFFAPRDLNCLPLPWFTNHSCDPNSGFDKKGNLIALRTIPKGSEVVWDYSTEEHNPKFRMKCKCGSKNCRKIITAS